MKKNKVVTIYFESENVSIRIVSNPESADVVINGDGTITSVSNVATAELKTKSLMDMPIFKEEDKSIEEIIPKNIPRDPHQLEVDISELLINLGILPNIKGYRYTIEAVKILINDPNAIGAVTKVLYPKVGEIFNTTPAKTERAIRHSIEIAFNRGNAELLNKLFVVPNTTGKSKPTNSEFLSRIAEQFRMGK